MRSALKICFTVNCLYTVKRYSTKLKSKNIEPFSDKLESDTDCFFSFREKNIFRILHTYPLKFCSNVSI